MSKEENFSFSINNMRESIDRILSGQRRGYVLRFVITFNVIYTIVVGIVVFHKGLEAVYIIHQYFSSSDSEFSPEFLLSEVDRNLWSRLRSFRCFAKEFLFIAFEFFYRIECRFGLRLAHCLQLWYHSCYGIHCLRSINSYWAQSRVYEFICGAKSSLQTNGVEKCHSIKCDYLKFSAILS